MFMSNGNIQSAQFMGLINAMRTGDPTVDMIGAMVIPFVLQKAMHELPAGLRALLRRKQKVAKKMCTRTVSYRTTNNNCGVKMDYDDGSFNMYLIRAMKMYLHKRCKLNLDEAAVDLVMLDHNATNGNNQGGRTRARRNGQGMCSTFEMLQDTSMVERPLANEWHAVGTFEGSEVEMLMSDSVENPNGGGGENDGGDGNSNGNGGRKGGKGGGEQPSIRTMDITLRSEGGVKPIDKFIKDSYSWYMDELKKLDCSDRYMFDVNYGAAGSGGYRNGSTPNYSAYKLSDEKTFDSLFSRQCHDLIKTVDQFQTRTGKYGIRGFPHKLGLLLSGPPGTGKTSLIKAMANHTGRHIVNVNLAKIQTNEELMLLFFNKNYFISGSNPQNLRLDYSDVIFVLEDVDSASHVVMDRNLKKKMLEKQKKKNKSKDKKFKKMLRQSGAGRRGKTMRTRQGRFRDDRMHHAEEGEDSDSESDSEDEYPDVFGNRKSNSYFASSDELNLSGILNVLDGVVDTPNRMVIMTTNHPEMLDAALIRPGRIDKQLVLGHMIQQDIVDMVQHYFQSKMDTKQKQEVGRLIKEHDLKITPAQIEQMAVDVSTINDFLTCLEQFAVKGGQDNGAAMICTSDDVVDGSDSEEEEEEQEQEEEKKEGDKKGEGETEKAEKREATKSPKAGDNDSAKTVTSCSSMSSGEDEEDPATATATATTKTTTKEAAKDVIVLLDDDVVDGGKKMITQ